MNYITLIEDYKPGNNKDDSIRKSMLQFMKKNEDDVLTRKNTMAHVTASSVILNESINKMLMIHHKIYDTWTWQGGHADGESDLLKVAIKEAYEETGIEKVTVIQEENKPVIRLDILPVMEHIKNGEFITAHMHLNVAFVFIASEKELLKVNTEETNGLKWISLNEIDAYAKEPEITPIYHKLIAMAESAMLRSQE